jgi:hypothetical protein
MLESAPGEPSGSGANAASHSSQPRAPGGTAQRPAGTP